MNVDPYLTPYTKIHLKGIIGLNIEVKTEISRKQEKIFVILVRYTSFLGLP
jgi:hypothetical protein